MGGILEKKFQFPIQNKKKFFIYILIFCLVIGSLVIVVIVTKKKNLWSHDLSQSLKDASQSNKPIILAIVKQSCNDKKQNLCPYSTQNQSILNSFQLVEIIHGSKEYIELSYDDRFLPDIEYPPVFYLLNPDGEIRDLRTEFPTQELLERWVRIQ